MSVKKFVDLAIQAAKKSFSQFKHGAVVVRRNKVLGIGNNQLLPGNKSVHAEKDAILNSIKRWKNISGSCIYIIRIDSNGNFKISKPCLMCAKLLLKLKISSAYYSTNDCDDCNHVPEIITIFNVENYCTQTNYLKRKRLHEK